MIDLFAAMGVVVLFCLSILIFVYLPFILVRKLIFLFSKGGKVLNEILSEIDLGSRKRDDLRYGRTENFSWFYQPKHLFSRKLALRDKQGNMINTEFSWQGTGRWVFMLSNWEGLPQWQVNLLSKIVWNRFRDREIKS